MRLSLHRKGISRLSLLLSTICLCIPALLNLFPFIYSDSGTYIQLGFDGTGFSFIRPLMYGLFLRHVSLMESLWIVIFVQAFLVAWFIRQFSLIFFEHKSPFADLLMVAILCICTSIGVTTGMLMPDFTTPLMIIATCIILLAKKRSRWRNLAMGLMIWFAVACHHSHAYILLFTLISFAGAMMLRNRSLKIKWGRWLTVLAWLLLGYLSIPGLNYMRSEEFVSNKASNVFLVSRFHQMGLLQPFLEEKCPEKDYRICEFAESIPRDFLWSADSPLQKDGGWDINNERYRQIIADFMGDPFFLKKFLIKSIETGFMQFFNFNTVVLHPLKPREWPQTAFEQHLPDMVYALELSRQNLIIWNPYVLDMVQRIVVFTCMLFLIYVYCYQSKYSISVLHQNLALLLLLGLLSNAYFCGGISMLAHRFQSRVIWLVPLLAMHVGYLVWQQRSKLAKDQSTDSRGTTS